MSCHVSCYVSCRVGLVSAATEQSMGEHGQGCQRANEMAQIDLYRWVKRYIKVPLNLKPPGLWSPAETAGLGRPALYRAPEFPDESLS